MTEVRVPMNVKTNLIINWLHDNVPAQHWFWNADTDGIILECNQDALAFKLKFDL